MLPPRRYVAAGWNAGAISCLGVGLFGWANPYVAFLVTLGGAALTATVYVASASTRIQEER